MAEVARMIVGLGLDASRFDAGLARATASVSSFKSDILRVAGIASVGTLFTSAVTSALDFGDAMGKVNTLIGNTTEIEKLSDSVRALSKTFGRSVSEEAAALFKIVQNGARTAAEAADQMTAANVLARASFTDVATAADVITTIFDAYGASAGTAAQVSDKLFAAMRGGETSIAELGNSLGDLAPLAADLGISLDQLLAAFATISARGGSATRALTGIRAVITGLGTPSKEASDLARRLGIDFSAAGLQAKGFGAFMEDVAVKTKGSVLAMQTLFGSARELAPALRLAANAGKDFAAQLAPIADATGAALRAADAVGKLPAEQFRILKEIGADALRSFGLVILQIVVPAIEKLRDNWVVIRDMATDVAKAIGVVSVALGVLGLAFAAVKVQAFITTLAALVPLVVTVADGFAFAQIAVGTFWATALGPAALVVTAIGLVTAAFHLAGKAAREATAEALAFQNAATAQTPEVNMAVFEQNARQIDALKTRAATITTAMNAAIRAGDRSAVGAFQSDLIAVTREMTRLGAQSKAAQDAIRKVWETTSAANAAKSTAPKATPSLGGAGSGGAADQLKDIEQRINRLLEAERQIGDIAGTQLPQLPAALVAIWGEANALLARQSDKLSEVSVKARSLIESLNTSASVVASRLAGGDATLGTSDIIRDAGRAIDAEVAKLKPVKFPAQLVVLPPTTGEIRGLQDAVQRVIDARGMVDISALTGSTAFVAETKAQLQEAERAFRVFATRAASALMDPALSAAELQAQITALAGAINTVGASDKAARNVAKLADNVIEVATAARGLLQVAQAIGKIGDESAKSVGHVIDLVGAVGQLVKGLTTGDLSSILSGAVGSLGSILSLSGVGESAAEKEGRKLQKENSERIAELTRTMGGLSNNIGQFGRVGIAAADPRAQQLANNARGERGAFGDAELEKLHIQLARLGVSYADLTSAAKELGITLRDSAGNLVKGALAELAAAIQLQIKHLTQFGNSLDDQRTKATLRQRVLGQDLGAQGDIKLNLDFLASLAPDLWKKFFQGIDLGDTNAVQEATKNLTRAFLLGQISAEEFAGLLGKGDLAAIILGVQDGLDGLKKATDAAAQSMLNIPSGLKLEALRFDATAAVARSMTAAVAKLPTTTTTATPTVPVIAPVPTVQNSGPQFMFAPGSITIQTKDGPTAEAWRAVLSGIQGEARSRFGDATRWPDVN